MTNKEAIQVFKEYICDIGMADGKCITDIKIFREAIDMAIKVLDQTRWIPVIEKPKEAGCYMTTVDYGEYGLAAGQRFFHKDIGEWSDECVIAWMPLPEPYKPHERKNK